MSSQSPSDTRDGTTHISINPHTPETPFNQQAELLSGSGVIKLLKRKVTLAFFAIITVVLLVEVTSVLIASTEELDHHTLITATN